MGKGKDEAMQMTEWGNFLYVLKKKKKEEEAKKHTHNRKEYRLRMFTEAIIAIISIVSGQI